MVGTYLPPWQKAPGFTLRDAASHVFVCSGFYTRLRFRLAVRAVYLSATRFGWGEETERAANKCIKSKHRRSFSKTAALYIELDVWMVLNFLGFGESFLEGWTRTTSDKWWHVFDIVLVFSIKYVPWWPDWIFAILLGFIPIYVFCPQNCFLLECLLESVPRIHFKEGS